MGSTLLERINWNDDSLVPAQDRNKFLESFGMENFEVRYLRNRDQSANTVESLKF